MSAYDRPANIPWPPILVLACIASGYGLSQIAPIASAPTLPVWVWSFGIGMILTGLLLDAYCAYFLLKSKTAVLPNRAASHLVTYGPFRLSRNPIYLGYLLIILGAALYLPSLWMLIFAIVYCVLISSLSIRSEEAHLEARFGDDWKRYKKCTPRWFGPF